MKKREALLETRLTNAVKKAGGMTLKLPSMFYRGIPDRMILLPGPAIYFVELKRAGGTLPGNQARWIRFLRSLGFTAGSVRGEEALETFLDKYVR